VVRPRSSPASSSPDVAPTSAAPSAEDAQQTARRATAAAGITLHEVHDHHLATSASTLLDTVWARRTGSVMSPEALIALAHAGGQVTVARAATREAPVVAATAAFLGRDADTGAVFLHSHVTGVLPEHAGRGIGTAMKWHQRAWCLARGIAEVRWTFDPLVRRNAVLNLVVLGAQVARYDRDVYGPMADARNAGLPTDRLTASWVLDAPRVRVAAEGRPASPDLDGLRRAGAEPVLSVGPDDAPRHHDVEAARRLVQVPADIESLRARDRDLATAWADAIRATLGDALDAGARVGGLTRDGWYLVATQGGVAELTDRR
jgi:predicted GNAT superfamily acetyltransferase